MKKIKKLSFFLLLMNCATAISQELMCRHYDVSAGKNTKYAWFELRLDEVQTDKNSCGNANWTLKAGNRVNQI